MSILRKSLRLKGKLIKLAFILLIVGINAFFLWRIFSSSTPKDMQTLWPNEALAEAYAQDEKLSGMFYQDQRSITSSESNYGYFSVTDSVIIPEANQLQLVLRYNNSTIRSLAQDYSLDTVPERDEELFDVTLLVAKDLTPGNADDNLTADNTNIEFIRVHGSCVASEQKNLYNYRKFVFDFGDLDIKALKESGLLVAIYADVYYNGDINYEQTAYGTLCLYDYITKDRSVRISSADVKAIEEWKERNS